MKRWYVAQVYAGYEEIVKKDLERRIKELKSDLFGQILLPTAKMKTMLSGGDEGEEELLFSGYILIEMEKNPESLAVVAGIPKILKFLGGKDPVPLTKKEIERVLLQVSGEVAVSSGPKEEFVVGGEVDIQEGPFAGFVGIIDRVDEEGEKLSVMVSIFGRLTPVELAFDQVKK
jgi:transcription termination/antitermination protein NusG